MTTDTTPPRKTMRPSRILICTALAAISFNALSTDLERGMRFSNLSIKDGLSHNFVCDICQDTLGTVWFATADGLNRFDGNSISTYRHIRGDKNSIQSNNVHKIRKDSENNIWICSSNGLSRYNALSDNFQRINIPGAIAVENLQVLGNGKFLVATRNASYLYNDCDGSVSEIKLGGKPFVFYSSCRNGNDIIICSKARTVEILNLDNDSLARRVQPIAIPKFGIVPIPDIFNRDSYWIGTKGAGLLHINVNTGECRSIPLTDKEWLEVFAVEYDDNGNLWVGTGDGLYILHGDKVIYHFKEDELEDKIVRALYKDSSSGMWIGTNYGGASYWNVGRDKFKQFRIPDPRFSANKSIITYLKTEDEGSLWVGTRYEGLFHYSKGRNAAEHYNLDDVRTLQYSDDRRYVYTGAEVNGLHRIDLKSGKVERMISIRDIMAITPAGNGKFWLGTLIGLFLYDTESNEAKLISMPPYSGKLIRILTLFSDRNNNLWIGAKESLRVYKIGDNYTLTNVTPDCLRNIVHTQCIHQSKDGTVWIGNVDGLMSFRQDSTGESNINPITSLTAATVRGIEEDEYGHLWVSTDNGLYKYDPATGKYRLYNYNDGLRCSLFNTCAHSSDTNGNFLFGGIYGIETFKPKDIRTDSSSFRTILTELIVNNEHIKPHDGTGILDKDIKMTERIILRHWQNSITICFACPDMISWNSSRYMYKLNGFDKDWTLARGNEATYTKLPKGRYTLLVRSANNDGVWSEHPSKLEITVRPVWYKSTASIIFFILVLCGSTVYAAILFIGKKIARKEAEKAKEIEVLKQQYEEKLQKNRLLLFIEDPHSLKPQDEKFLSNALSDIEKNISNNAYSVESLASALCVSRGNLYLRIKSAIGKTPVELIKALRMERACSLLKESELSITEIADETGFDNSAYFITVFKSTYGETPGKYRTRIKG